VTATPTPDLMARLRRHYIDPSKPLTGGVLVPEVGWNGPGGSRRCDAVYIGFTSASGRLMVGHEVKTSRSDWRRELDKVGKADQWHDQCHAWYIVAPDTDVVPPAELPAGWGLLTVNPRSKTRLTVTVKAAVRANHEPSWDAVRSVIARWDTLRADDLYHARRKLQQQLQDKADEQLRQRMADSPRMTTTERRRMDALDALEAVLGIKITEMSWPHGDAVPAREVGAALALVAGLRDLPDQHQLDSAVKQARRAADVLELLNRDARRLRAATRPRDGLTA
jgi:hypothetical protein